MRALRARVVAAASLIAIATTAAAQDFPAKPIRMVTFAAPGDGGDLVSRTLAPGLSKALGQQIIVVNMPGAGGVLAHRYVAKQAPADGYTLLNTVSVVLAAPIFVKDPGYDDVKDLAPVSTITSSAIFLITNMQTPWKTFNEMVTYARANPGKINIGLSGLSDTNALHMEGVKQKLGINIVNVPYKGSSAIIQGLLANEVQLTWTGAVLFAGLDRNKTARGLAVSGTERSPLFPDIPTLAELGHPGVENINYMIFSVAGTPRPIIERLNAAIGQAIRMPEVEAGLNKLGYQVVGSTPEALAQRIAVQRERLQALAKSAGIQPQ